MSVQDLVFTITSDGSGVFDPLTTSATPVDVTVTNYGTDDLEDLGFFVTTSTNLGDVDNPADYPPETDYQDLIEWGTSTKLGLTVQGGLKITVPQENGSSLITYFSRSEGATLANKIPCANLAAGETFDFTLQLETPPSVAARRLFVDVVLE